jgi:hypothetical protein
MWAITSYFNPARYKRRLSNYRRFRADLGAPLVTVELSFDGMFELTKEDADILIQIKGGAVLWQKERLLNVALRAVPAEERFIAWLDCDVIFGESNWAFLAEQSLAADNVIQLFSDILDLDSGDTGPARGDETKPPTGYSFVKKLGSDPEGAFAENLRIKNVPSTNRGLAWAARREIIDKHGFYDAVIAGKSDRAMAFAMCGRFDKFLSAIDCNKHQEKHYLKWALPFSDSIHRRIGHLPGRIYHLWHGDKQNRKYIEMERMVASSGFNPETDIYIGVNGSWEWTQPRSELATSFELWFANRREDGDG